MSSALPNLTLPVASPGKRASALAEPASPVPPVAAQFSDKALWAFVIIGIVIAVVSIYLFGAAEKAGSNTVITDAGGYAITDNAALMYVVAGVMALSAAYASYRAFRAYDGDSQAEAKRGYVLALFAVNMLLTAMWFNQYYGHPETTGHTATLMALGVAVTSGLMAVMFWQKDRVCGTFAVINCVIALLGAYATYKLAVATVDESAVAAKKA